MREMDASSKHRDYRVCYAQIELRRIDNPRFLELDSAGGASDIFGSLPSFSQSSSIFWAVRYPFSRISLNFFHSSVP